MDQQFAKRDNTAMQADEASLYVLHLRPLEHFCEQQLINEIFRNKGGFTCLGKFVYFK